jgi:CheY-like chemotaxis protein
VAVRDGSYSVPYVPPTIYLFEDDPDLRRLLAELLESELQARVVACGTIDEVLERSASSPPDLIVADFWGASHLTLSERERQQIADLGAVAPTVLVSARQWALDAGPEERGLAAVVHKPLDIEAFVTAMREMLPSGEAEGLSREAAVELPHRDSLSVLVLPFAHGAT